MQKHFSQKPVYGHINSQVTKAKWNSSCHTDWLTSSNIIQHGVEWASWLSQSVYTRRSGDICVIGKYPSLNQSMAVWMGVLYPMNVISDGDVPDMRLKKINIVLEARNPP